MSGARRKIKTYTCGISTLQMLDKGTLVIKNGGTGPSPEEPTRPASPDSCASKAPSSPEKVYSVIVATFNRAHLLARLLESLRRQTLPAECFEIIVVDDGSTDRTGEVIEQMRARMPNLRWKSLPANRGQASALNHGVHSAHCDYLLFTDDDCIAAPDWVERLGSAVRQHPYVTGAVACFESDFLGLVHHITEFHSVMSGRGRGKPQFVAGANMAIQRKTLETLGGFSRELLVAHDMEFCLRFRSTGRRVYFASDAVVLHDPERRSLRKLLEYSEKHARSTILLRQRYRTVLNTPFLLRSPCLIALAAPIIACKSTLEIFLRNARAARHLRTAPFVYVSKLAWCLGAARSLWRVERGRP
jgi:GT2 family glycosyltransferase